MSTNRMSQTIPSFRHILLHLHPHFLNMYAQFARWIILYVDSKHHCIISCAWIDMSKQHDSQQNKSVKYLQWSMIFWIRQNLHHWFYAGILESSIAQLLCKIDDVFGSHRWILDPSPGASSSEINSQEYLVGMSRWSHVVRKFNQTPWWFLSTYSGSHC